VNCGLLRELAVTQPAKEGDSDGVDVAPNAMGFAERAA